MIIKTQFPEIYGKDGECRLEYKKRLYEEVQALMEQGYRHFITGMADGVDVDFAIAVLYFKNKFAGVTLEAALPYPRNAYQTNADPMNVKENILSKPVVIPSAVNMNAAKGFANLLYNSSS